MLLYFCCSHYYNICRLGAVSPWVSSLAGECWDVRCSALFCSELSLTGWNWGMLPACPLGCSGPRYRLSSFPQNPHFSQTLNFYHNTKIVWTRPEGNKANWEIDEGSEMNLVQGVASWGPHTLPLLGKMTTCSVCCCFVLLCLCLFVCLTVYPVLS